MSPQLGPQLANYSKPGGISRQLTTSAETSAQLQLSVSKKKSRLDEPIQARIELWNRGTEDLYASHLLFPFLNGPAYLVLEFEDAAGRADTEGTWIAEFSGHAIHEWWTRIAPSHFLVPR